MSTAKCYNFNDTLIDTNIASDYGKIRRLFNLGTIERNNLILEK